MRRRSLSGLKRFPWDATLVVGHCQSGVDSVAVAWRVTRDNYARRVRTSIEHPMTLAGRDLKASAGVKNEAVLLHVNGQLSRENVEELARMEVEVLDLTCARRHKLFDDAEIGCPDEMPAVAVLSLRTTPFVMLGRLRADDLCHRRMVPLFGAG
jgi:hypothetical protein